MRWFIYGMIGLGFIASEPYYALPLSSKAFVYFAWPAVVTRDIINEAAHLRSRQREGGR